MPRVWGKERVGMLMLQKVREGLNAAVLAAAVFLMTSGSPGLAHENHEALGAGPGPKVTAGATAPAPGGAAVENKVAAAAHENMAASHDMAAKHHEAAADQNKTFGQRLVSWLGRLHTLVIHFPIAMFVGALGIELFGLWRGDGQYRSAAHVMLIVGALGAAVAAFIGWFAGGFYLTDRNQILMLHRWLGTAIAGAGFILVYLSAMSRRERDKSRTIYWIALVAMTIAIAIQGYIGGSFMHGGMDHMAF